MASEEDLKSNSEDDFEWNVENEIRLFEAMIGLKPVGINKHFHMACISEKFETLIGKPISSDVIWKHLGSMFDLSTLDKKESLPFPNEIEEFSLPEAEYSDLMNQKLQSKTENIVESKENVKTVKDTFTVKESVTTKKEKKADVEESTLEVDKKESVESENESKKGKVNKDEKPVKRRGYRSLKDKKPEEENSQNPVSTSKKEEEPVSIPSSNKKEKKPIGKRSLRSRGDDSSSKSSTPPPVKRPRRI